MKKTIGFLISAMLAMVGSLGGQSVQNGQLGVTRDAALSQAVRQLGPRARVRVSAGAKVTEGELIGRTYDGVTIETRAGASMPIPINTIDGMWMRRNYIGRGAAIGGGLGAAAFGALGHAFVTGMCDRTTGCGSEAMGATLLGALVGAAGGVVVGGAAGMLTRRWVRLDPAP